MPAYSVGVPGPTVRVLSPTQLETLAKLGEERSAAAGETLFEIGDATYPFIAILEGEAAVTRCGRAGDRPPRRLRLPRRDEPALRPDRVPHRRRHRADALHRRRARSPAAAAVRGSPPSPTSCSPHSSSAARCCSSARGSGLRSSVRATRPRPGARSSTRGACAPPTPGRAGAQRGGGGADRRPRPGGAAAGAAARRCRAAAAEQRRAFPGARDRARARSGRGGRPAGPRRRPGRPRRRGLRRLRGPRHAGDREHRARRPGRHLAPDRELPRLSGRHQRLRADQPRRLAGAQVPRPDRDPLPGPGADAGDGDGLHRVELDDGVEVRPAPCALDRGRIPPPAGRGLEDYEGFSVFYAAGPRRRSSAAPSASPSSAAATRPPRPRSGWPAAAPWSPSCTAAPTSGRRCPTT